MLLVYIMSQSNASLFNEVYPKSGEIYQSDSPTLVLCKPKILPIKSITLEKLEQMQEKLTEEAQFNIKEAGGESQKL